MSTPPDPYDMRSMPDHYPERGDQIEAWIKSCRDDYELGTPEWGALDNLLDEYRLAADTMQSLENMVNGTETDNLVREPKLTKKKTRISDDG